MQMQEIRFVRTCRLAAGLLVATLLAACGPLLTLPGGALEGAVSAAPDDWAFSADVDTVQLETRPSDPYTVNVWLVGIGRSAYVHAGANHADWAQHIEADPRVRVQVGEHVFALQATRVTSQAEFDTFSNAYEKKYGMRPRNERANEVWLFRLDAPSG